MVIELGELTFFSLHTKENKETGRMEVEVTLKCSPHSQETIDAVESIVASERLKVVLETIQPKLI